MFVGHFGVAFAAKRVAPKASLGTLLFASVFLDVVWPVLVLAGVESFRIVPGATAVTPLDFVSYPWSHSLLMTGVWAAALGGTYAAFRKDAATAAVVGGLVASHWLLDWISHRPDMPLAPGVTFKVGAGLWRSIPATLAVEGGIFAAGIALYMRATRARDRTGRYAWASYVVLLTVLYLAGFGPPPHPGEERLVTWVSLAAVLLVPWAAWIDRHRESDARRPGAPGGAQRTVDGSVISP